MKLKSNRKYDKQTKSAHSLLIAPPTNIIQVIDDYTFALCIASRYHVDELGHTDLRYEKCDDVKSLRHILRCMREQMGSNLYIHGKIKCTIGAALKKIKRL